MDVQHALVILNVNFANWIIIWKVFVSNVFLELSCKVLLVLHATVLVQLVKLKPLIVYLANPNTTWITTPVLNAYHHVRIVNLRAFVWIVLPDIIIKVIIIANLVNILAQNVQILEILNAQNVKVATTWIH